MKVLEFKLLRGIIPLLLISLALSGCFGMDIDNKGVLGDATSQDAQVEAVSDINDVSIIDNPLLYAKDDPYSLDTMYLTVRKGNQEDGTNFTWKEVNTYSTYYYDDNNIDRYKVEGLIQTGDASGPKAGDLGYNVFAPNAIVQVRGKTTSLYAQKSFKIEIKKDKGLWREQRSIILNKHVFDSVRFRNKLSYDLMRGYPELIGARTQFVHLYVCDQTENDPNAKFTDYGLYTQVEQMNSRYLANHGLDENGQFYKANMFEFYTYSDILRLSTDENYDKKAFEQVLEIKGSEDHTKLLSMLKDLNSYQIPIEEIFAEYFDEENYFSWLAFQMLTGNTDIVSQNFYLYSPRNGNKWYFIPWDNDGAWGSCEIPAENAGYNYEKGISQYWGSVLHQRVLKSPVLREKLRAKIEMFHQQLTPELLASRIESYRLVAEPFRFITPDNMYASETHEQYNEIIKSMPKEVEYNYQMYLESLLHPAPFMNDTPEVVNGKLSFSSNPSYDFAAEPIFYSFELATDYNFTKLVSKAENLTIPKYENSILTPGQYFYRFIATNQSGKLQTSMTYYRDTNEIKHYGVCMFYVQPDGSIVWGQS